MKYKLGSQLVSSSGTDEEIFEWNLCWMGNDNNVFGVVESVYLGNRSNRDPIIYKARELVKMLNEENV